MKVCGVPISPAAACLSGFPRSIDLPIYRRAVTRQLNQAVPARNGKWKGSGNGPDSGGFSQNHLCTRNRRAHRHWSDLCCRPRRRVLKTGNPHPVFLPVIYLASGRFPCCPLGGFSAALIGTTYPFAAPVIVGGLVILIVAMYLQSRDQGPGHHHGDRGRGLLRAWHCFAIAAPIPPVFWR